MTRFIEQPRYSCALGAQQSVLAIKRAVPIIHAGPGCSTKITSFVDQGEGYTGGNSIPCTNTGETEVIYGGEEKLRNVIDGAFKVIDADLYVVLTGCTSDIVGDDISSVTGEFQNQGRPIVYAETGGFKSNNYVSHSIVVNAIIDQYVDKFKNDEHVIKGLVNVFATIPYQDPFWNGNLEEIKRILEGIGLKVNILFGQNSEGIDEWKTIPNAEFNIVISAWAGISIVEHLEEKYGTPFLHFPYFPVGALETTQLLRQIADFGKLDKVKLEAFIYKEESKFYEYIERMADFVLEFKYGLPRKFYTILDASYSIGVSKYLLNELGILPQKQFIVDDTPEKYKTDIIEQFNKISNLRAAEVSFLIDGGAIHQEITLDDNKNRSLIVGSAWEKDLAREKGADLLILNIPVTYRLPLSRGYLGYKGGITFIEDVYDKVLDTFS